MALSEAAVPDAEELLQGVVDDILERVACRPGLVTWRGGLSTGGHLEAKCRQSPRNASFQGKGGREEDTTKTVNQYAQALEELTGGEGFAGIRQDSGI